MKYLILAAMVVASPAAQAVDMCQVGVRQDFQYWIDAQGYELKPSEPAPVATVRGGTLHLASDHRSFLTFFVRPADCRTGEGNVYAADELMRQPEPIGVFSVDEAGDVSELGRLICHAYRASGKDRARILKAGSCGKNRKEPGDGMGFGRVK